MVAISTTYADVGVPFWKIKYGRLAAYRSWTWVIIQCSRPDCMLDGQRGIYGLGLLIWAGMAACLALISFGHHTTICSTNAHCSLAEFFTSLQKMLGVLVRIRCHSHPVAAVLFRGVFERCNNIFINDYQLTNQTIFGT